MAQEAEKKAIHCTEGDPSAEAQIQTIGCSGKAACWFTGSLATASHQSVLFPTYFSVDLYSQENAPAMAYSEATRKSRKPMAWLVTAVAANKAGERKDTGQKYPEWNRSRPKVKRWLSAFLLLSLCGCFGNYGRSGCSSLFDSVLTGRQGRECGDPTCAPAFSSGSGTRRHQKSEIAESDEDDQTESPRKGKSHRQRRDPVEEMAGRSKTSGGTAASAARGYPGQASARTEATAAGGGVPAQSEGFGYHGNFGGRVCRTKGRRFAEFPAEQNTQTGGAQDCKSRRRFAEPDEKQDAGNAREATRGVCSTFENGGSSNGKKICIPNAATIPNSGTSGGIMDGAQTTRSHQLVGGQDGADGNRCHCHGEERNRSKVWCRTPEDEDGGFTLSKGTRRTSNHGREAQAFTWNDPSRERLKTMPEADRPMCVYQGNVMWDEGATESTGHKDVSLIDLQSMTLEADPGEAQEILTLSWFRPFREKPRWHNFVMIVVGGFVAFVSTFLFLLLCERPGHRGLIVVGGVRHSKRGRQVSCKGTGKRLLLTILYLQGTHLAFVEGLATGGMESPVTYDLRDQGTGAPGLIQSLGNAEDAPRELRMPRSSEPLKFDEDDGLHLMALGSHFGTDPREGVGEPRSLETLPEIAVNQEQDAEEGPHSDDDSALSQEESAEMEEEEEMDEEIRDPHNGDHINRTHPVEDEGREQEGPFTVSDGAEEEDWTHFFQFRRHHIQRHCFLRWNNYFNIISNIANTWEVSREAVHQLIQMTVEVTGIPEGSKKAIVVIRDDDPSSDERSHVLVDVVWHTTLLFREGPQIHRRVLRLVTPMARTAMLLSAEVGGYCRDQRDRCLVSLNGESLLQQDIRVFAIPSGSYIRIDVPPREDCLEDQISLLQLGVSQRISFRLEATPGDETFPPELSSEKRFTLIAADFENRTLITEDLAPCCRSGWSFHSFENLSPPGNPAPLVFDIASGDEAEEVVASNCPVFEIDSEGETEQTTGPRKFVNIKVSLPENMTDMLKLLQPWPTQALELDFDPACPILPVSLQFLSGCQVGIAADVEDLYIYTDGSFARNNGVSAFAFAVFGWSRGSTGGHHRFLGWLARTTILDPDHPNFSGAIAHAVDEAEASALIWALIWLLQSGLRLPCYFCFDSLNIGLGASGRWNVRTGWLQGERLRELAQYAEAIRVGCPIHYEHVKAHSQQPGNELVDGLAYSITHDRVQETVGDIPDWSPIFRLGCNTLAWAWWTAQSYFDKALPDIQNHEHSWDYIDWRGQEGVQSLESQLGTSQSQELVFSLQLATYNVMTLKAYHQPGQEFAGLGAAHLLRQQLHQAGYQIIGLQETRATTQCTLTSDDFIRFVSGHPESRGHRGVELWISRLIPFTCCTDGPRCFKESDISVLVAHDDLLIATINCAGHLLVIYVCHAPYDGADIQRKNDWWTKLDEFLNKYRRKGRTILLGDFNARMGRHVDEITGDRLCDKTNDNGERFEALLQRHSIWLPATYSTLHSTRDDTWVHPRGHRSRLDYIGLDCLAWWNVMWSGVEERIMVTHTAMDHSLVGLSLTWQEDMCKQKVKRRSYDWEAMATDEGRQQLQNMLQDIPTLPWNCEVHHQWDFYDNCIHSGLQHYFPAPKRRTRSDIFTQATWDRLSQKARLKEHLTILDQAMDRCWYKLFWIVWKTGQPLRSTCRLELMQISAVHLLRLFVLRSFRITAGKLREQTKEDKTQFVNSVVDKASSASTTDVFKELRLLRVGSRFRKMKQQPLPQVLDGDLEHALDGEARDRVWLQHCSKLEAAVETTTHRLLQRIRQGSFNRAAQFPHRSLEEAPTLLDLERSFRRIKRAKAPGHDGLRSDLCSLAPVEMSKLFFPILAKMVFQMNEPLQSKGGVMIAAYKGGRHDLIDNYRGLLLSSHTGKALRRTIRQRLQEHYARTAPPLHVSIKLGGCVSHASHALRAYQSIAHQKGWSVGVLFLDVKAAYYRVVRQLAATLSNSDEDISRVLRYFELPPEHLQDLLSELHHGSECRASEVPPHLEGLVAELLSGTWFMTGTKQGLCEGLAGSRPGDGLADIVFGFIFKRVLSRVVDEAASLFDWAPCEIAGDFDLTTPPPLGLSCPPFIDVVWADDLAFSAMHEDADTLIHIMTTCTTLIFKQVLRHGMLPNLKAGKTELLFSCRGRGSRKAKQRIFNVIDPILSLPDAPEGYREVRLTAKYRHLGTQVHISENQLYEVKARLGQSMTVFRTHRRQIFQNPRLSKERRCFLFQTMILSILQYNIGTWYDLNSVAFKYLRSKLYNMYRSLCRATIPEDELRLWNDGRMLAFIELPDVATMLHGARLRYSMSLGRSAPQA